MEPALHETGLVVSLQTMGTPLPPATRSLRACDMMFMVSRFTLAFSARR
jgi:hypothetical protein